MPNYYFIIEPMDGGFFIYKVDLGREEISTVFVSDKGWQHFVELYGKDSNYKFIWR